MERYETSEIDETCYDGWHTKPTSRSICYNFCYFIMVVQAYSFEARKNSAGDYCIDQH